MDDTDARRRNHWVSHIARHAHEKPGAVYLRFEGRTITWAQIHERVSGVAAALRERGVRAGDRVAIMMTNRPEFLETMFAASAIGAIVVPVNFRLAPDEIAYILTDSGASLLVVEEATAAAAASARAACAHEIGFVSTGHVDGADPYFPAELRSGGAAGGRRARGQPRADHVHLRHHRAPQGRGADPREPHVPVAHAHPGLAAVRRRGGEPVRVAAVPHRLHRRDRADGADRRDHGLLPSGGFSSAATLDVMEAERVTSVFLVPAQWQLLCDDASLASRDLSALKTMSWGAAPATTTLLTRMAEAFPGVTNVAVFGQTEMSPVTCALSGEDALRKIGSVGKPVSIVAARIVDDDMKDVPPGEVGEIVYRGPSVMAGYWQNPAATAEAFRGGWFHSGDLVRADEEGFLYVVDRKKDMIITGGENVYCAEVENALSAHPAVAELAVIGAPHERWGETPVAVAVLAPGASLTLDELRDWGTARLARYKLPTVLHIVDALPRNASGKVMKTALRREYR